MFYQTEAKPQGWRAVAVFEDRPDILREVLVARGLPVPASPVKSHA